VFTGMGEVGGLVEVASRLGQSSAVPGLGKAEEPEGGLGVAVGALVKGPGAGVVAVGAAMAMASGALELEAGLGAETVDVASPGLTLVIELSFGEGDGDGDFFLSARLMLSQARVAMANSMYDAGSRRSIRSFPGGSMTRFSSSGLMSSKPWRVLRHCSRPAIASSRAMRSRMVPARQRNTGDWSPRLGSLAS